MSIPIAADHSSTGTSIIETMIATVPRSSRILRGDSRLLIAWAIIPRRLSDLGLFTVDMTHRPPTIMPRPFSMIMTTAGPITTIMRTGRTRTIIGKRIFTGTFCAASSAN